MGELFDPGPLEIVGRSSGDRTTDFGAPHVQGPWDAEALTAGERERLTSVLWSNWRYFDRVISKAPAELTKGPRGGGRDRDAIADHVREAERAYSAKLGTRLPPRTPWGQQRRKISDALNDTRQEGQWPSRYFIRRCAWHVLDHAWEIEQRAPSVFDLPPAGTSNSAGVL